MTHPTHSQRALRVFISYAHEDDGMRKELVKHLALLQREHLIEKWDDRQIEGGQPWAGAIDANLEAADIVLLLVSASFLASDYCYEKEMNRALERHGARECRVIPVILRPCAWETAPFGDLQAVPDEGKAISKWEPVDDGYVRVEQGRDGSSQNCGHPHLQREFRHPSLHRRYARPRTRWLVLGLGGSLALLALGLGAYWWVGADTAMFRTKKADLAEPQIDRNKPPARNHREPNPVVPQALEDAESPRHAVVPVGNRGKGGLYVLAVGVTEYRDAELAKGMPFAAQDAITITQHFQRYGVRFYRPVEVRGLWNKQATRARIEEEMRAFASRIEPDDVFVLYLAGHSAVFEGDYHFIPQEAPYVNAQRLRDESLGQDVLRKLLAGVNTRNALVLLDTCSLGAFGEQRASDKYAIGQLSSLTRRPLIASAADDRMAQKGEGDHGVFTFVLLEGLRGAADPNRNGIIEVKELADYIEKTMPEITRRNWDYERFPISDIRGAAFFVLPKPEGKR